MIWRTLCFLGRASRERKVKGDELRGAVARIGKRDLLVEDSLPDRHELPQIVVLELHAPKRMPAVERAAAVNSFRALNSKLSIIHIM